MNRRRGEPAKRRNGEGRITAEDTEGAEGEGRAKAPRREEDFFVNGKTRRGTWRKGPGYWVLGPGERDLGTGYWDPKPRT